MGKTRKISWKALDQMVHNLGGKLGQTFGVEHRVLFVEIILPLSGSLYVRIPSDFALMSPKTTKAIYRVGEAYASYYSKLQEQLKTAPISVLSNDGEFVVSTNEVFTFIKNLSMVREDTISNAIEDIKLATGVDISDEEVSGSSSKSEEEEEEDGPGQEPETPGEDNGTVIEFDSDDEIEDYFENPEPQAPPREKVKPTKVKPRQPDLETFHVGIIYPYLHLKEFFKKVRDREFEKYEQSIKEGLEKFESGITQDMVSQIDRVLDDLRSRMAVKISEYVQREKAILRKMNEVKRVLKGAQQILLREMAIDPKKLQEQISDAKNDLRDLHINLTQVKEDSRRTLREFLAALEEIE